MTTDSNDTQTELTKLLLSEHKSTRRWKNIRFFIWLLVFVFVLWSVMGPSLSDDNAIPEVDKNYVALVRLDGVIKAGDSFSARRIIPALSRAFRDKNAKGVVLLINSPGGSPVQASMIHDKIIQLKEKYHKEVIVVGEDTLASGAYLVATAADKIYVNKDTITGSIGVIMEGFGFNDLMQKIGITRRVFTAGAHKDRLDPYEKLNPVDEAKIKVLLDAVHQDFINDVEQGRKGKLNGDNPKELFSGDFWTGTQAVKLGLADGTANVWDAMQENFGTTHYRDYSPQPGLLESMMRDVSTQLHVHLITHAALEEKL